MAYLMELPIEVANSPTYHRFDGVIRTLEPSEAGTLLGLVTGTSKGAARIKIDRAKPQSLLRVRGVQAPTPPTAPN
jgi:hypothetical protein